LSIGAEAVPFNLLLNFYNAERPHRKLNMKTPLQFETEFFARAYEEKKIPTLDSE
jgi:transposase InsO family protein